MNREFYLDEYEPVLDHCGIVAVHAPKSDVAFFIKGSSALETLQTRGQDGAGVASISFTGEVQTHTGEGMLDCVFPPSIQRELSRRIAQTWVFQVRYGTNGEFRPENVQPFIGVHEFSHDRFIVAHNGQFSDGINEVDDGSSDTLRFVKELAASSGHTWTTRITSALKAKRGAWSLAIGTSDGMFLARDPYGFRPLVYGEIWHRESKQKLLVAASETSALERVGVREFTEVMPGQLLRVTEDVVEASTHGDSVRPRPCIFETIYIHDGTSRAHLPRKNSQEINGSPAVDELRRRCGRILASEAPLTKEEVDFIVGVPGTGITGGRAYAESLGLPYVQVITDRVLQQNPRTFLAADIEHIHDLALQHFEFDTNAIKGKRIGIIDDSIVRGNIQRAVIALLRSSGAVEVHSRSLSPPIDKGCFLGTNTRTNGELIACQQKGEVEAIQRAIGANSLAYLSAAGLREALVGDRESQRFCMGCMVGHQPPIDRNGNIIYERK